MVRMRFVVPAAVVAVGATVATAGILRADAASRVTVPVPVVTVAAPLPSATTPQPAPAAALATGTPRPSASTARPAPAVTGAKGTENCAAGGAIAEGEYWLNNNQWGKDAGKGSQCVWETGRSGDTFGWGTSWKWTGEQNSVKSYVSAVLGWHWGFKAQGTGLPIRLSAGRSVRSSWDFKVTKRTANTMNVAYDLWLHDIAAPDWQNQPTDEVMVWLYRSGGAGPVGTKQATVTIGGTKWDLYRGEIGWNVFSFVRASNTSTADLNLTDFTDDLAGRGWLQRTKYLSSVQAGPEIFTGAGTLDTSAYSVTID